MSKVLGENAKMVVLGKKGNGDAVLYASNPENPKDNETLLNLYKVDEKSEDVGYLKTQTTEYHVEDAKGFHVGDLSHSEYESETGSKFATNEFNNYDDKPYVLETPTPKGSPFKTPTVPIESFSSAVNAVYHDSKIKETLAKAESLDNQGDDNYDFGKV